MTYKLQSLREELVQRYADIEPVIERLRTQGREARRARSFALDDAIEELKKERDAIMYLWDEEEDDLTTLATLIGRFPDVEPLLARLRTLDWEVRRVRCLGLNCKIEELKKEQKAISYLWEEDYGSDDTEDEDEDEEDV